jgi:hypothetical protein
MANDTIILIDTVQDHAGRHAGYKAAKDDRIVAVKSVRGVKHGTVMARVVAAIGRAKRVGDLADELAMTWNPPRSHKFWADPRDYVMGYVTHGLRKGLLAEAL